MDIHERLSPEKNAWVQLSTCEETANAVTLMASHALKILRLYSRRLDSRIYDTMAFTESIKQFALTRRFSQCRIIVTEPKWLVQKGHGLLNLSYSLSSFIKIRSAPKKYSTLNHNILICDRASYYLCKNDSRYEGGVNFNDAKKCKPLIERFDAIWEESQTSVALRNMLL